METIGGVIVNMGKTANQISQAIEMDDVFTFCGFMWAEHS